MSINYKYEIEAHGLSALKIGESNQIRLSLPIYGTTGRYV